jgi:phenylalanyl-tRNA synthetase beta chain
VARKLGKELSESEITGILRALGFGVGESSPGLLTVTVPTWRATKDISLKDDLVEEIGRIVGYGEIVPAAPLVASVVPPSNPMRLYLRRVRRQIADQGFTEVYNYSFITAADAKRFQLDLSEHIGVRNPIASELTHLRRSLLPGLFKSILDNVRHFPEFRLFEIGNELHPVAGGLPDEIPHLGAVLYAAHAGEQTFFEMKRVAECLLPGARLTADTQPAVYAHPQRSAFVFLDGAGVGRLFELHPSLLAAEGIEGRTVVLDIDLRASLELIQKKQFRYTPPRRYPTSGFDLSIVTPSRKPVGEIEDLLRKFAGESLASLEFVRQYEGPPLAEGEKSVSYHLEIGALDHTLTTEELSAAFNGIVEGMKKAGFGVRGAT